MVLGHPFMISQCWLYNSQRCVKIKLGFETLLRNLDLMAFALNLPDSTCQDLIFFAVVKDCQTYFSVSWMLCFCVAQLSLDQSSKSLTAAMQGRLEPHSLDSCSFFSSSSSSSSSKFLSLCLLADWSGNAEMQTLLRTPLLAITYRWLG